MEISVVMDLDAKLGDTYVVTQEEGILSALYFPIFHWLIMSHISEF